MEQKTYIMIKPDAVARGLAGRIIARFEDVGLKIERMELGTLTADQAAANYIEHQGKPFYDGLVAYITSGPVVKLVLSGANAVSVCRKLMGATNPADAADAEMIDAAKPETPTEIDSGRGSWPGPGPAPDS